MIVGPCFNDRMKKEIIFVVDPMCSWCWGFAPVIEALLKKNDYTFSLVLGGLRTKENMSWDEKSREYLQGHWRQVSHTTGQPFSNVLFDKSFFEYDTYPSCKALVSVRELFGMQKTFTYLHQLQHAFYVEGRDITQENVLMELADLNPQEVEKLQTFYKSDRAQVLMEYDFSKARSMGANAFPSVVIIDEEGHMVCQKGYRNLEEMNKVL